MREAWDDNQMDAARRLSSWMELYGKDVINLAYAYVHNYHQAEDLAQDVFLRALTKMDTFRGQSSVRTWLLSITANRCKDYLRSWTSKHEQSGEEQLEFRASGQNTEHEVADKLERDALWRAVAELPIKYREVIVLYYQRELSGQEVAEVLGTTEQTVRTRLHRARAVLKEILEREGAWHVGEA